MNLFKSVVFIGPFATSATEISKTFRLPVLTVASVTQQEATEDTQASLLSKICKDERIAKQVVASVSAQLVWRRSS